MKRLSKAQLREKNGFAVSTIAPTAFYPESVDDLKSLSNELELPFYILGDGSNTLFTEDNSPTVVVPTFKGISVKENDKGYLLTVQAGENWHQLVKFCIEQNMPGLENLALIPGSCGAAPVQNIGAYGVEFSNVCESVDFFSWRSKEVETLSNAQCRFGYRDSIFKQALKNKGIITSITLFLPKNWKPTLTYGDLKALPLSASPKEVMDKVIEIRQSKLPDPDVLPNTGSFFKNPVVSVDKFKSIQKKYSDIPNYAQSDGSIKLAAGWLIEKAGLKGYRYKSVGVHTKQALVLVNYGANNGSEIAELAKIVREKVNVNFGISLEVEVRAVSSQGEFIL